MVQIKRKEGHGVENPPPRSVWCGLCINCTWGVNIVYTWQVAIVYIHQVTLVVVYNKCSCCICIYQRNTYQWHSTYTLQHTATRCNRPSSSSHYMHTLQHTATRCNRPSFSSHYMHIHVCTIITCHVYTINAQNVVIVYTCIIIVLHKKRSYCMYMTCNHCHYCIWHVIIIHACVYI